MPGVPHVARLASEGVITGWETCLKPGDAPEDVVHGAIVLAAELEEGRSVFVAAVLVRGFVLTLARHQVLRRLLNTAA